MTACFLDTSDAKDGKRTCKWPLEYKKTNLLTCIIVDHEPLRDKFFRLFQTVY